MLTRDHTIKTAVTCAVYAYRMDDGNANISNQHH